jgi:hypothetical protein
VGGHGQGESGEGGGDGVKREGLGSATYHPDLQ